MVEELICRLGVYRQARNTYHLIAKRELRTARKQRQLFFRQFVKPGDLVFDIGANIGDLTAEFVELDAAVVAVEPLPQSAETVRKRYRCTVEAKAVGSSSGMVELHVGIRHFLSTVAPQRVVDRPEFFGHKVTVPMVTLDHLIERYGVPSFVKIDVEGYEHEVLEGLSSPVASLSFEFGLVSPRRTRECLDRLRQLGPYQFNFSVGNDYRLRDPGWVDSDRLVHELLEVSGTGDVYARLHD